MQVLSKGSLRPRPMLKTPWAAILRDQKRFNSHGPNKNDPPLPTVASLDFKDFDGVKIPHFRELAFTPEKPLWMRAGRMLMQSEMAMPAIKKWFDFVPTDKPGHEKKAGKVMSSYLKSFGSTAILPFELTYPQPHRLHGETIQMFIDNLRQEASSKSIDDNTPANPDQENVASLAASIDLANLLQSELSSNVNTKNSQDVVSHGPRSKPKFLHFTAPLALLDAAIQFNLKRPQTRVQKLYVAQAPVDDLPKELQDDLPVPSIVKSAGKGDIYSSSIWLGLEPTYTPLHRDPNPNLFVQLCGNKIVRLLPPSSGDQLFRDVQSRLGPNWRVNSRLRGPEMMSGPEREVMYKAVWLRDGLRNRQATEGSVVADQGSIRSKMQEARLRPGDSLFIPKGWWHSVVSEDDVGRLNASVNWWFR